VASIVLASFVGGAIFFIKIVPLIEYYWGKYNEACDLCGPLFRRICRLALEEGEDGRGQVVQRPHPPPQLQIIRPQPRAATPHQTPLRDNRGTPLIPASLRRVQENCDDRLTPMRRQSLPPPTPGSVQRHLGTPIRIGGGGGGPSYTPQRRPEGYFTPIIGVVTPLQRHHEVRPPQMALSPIEDADDEESPSPQSAYAPDSDYIPDRTIIVSPKQREVRRRLFDQCKSKTYDHNNSGPHQSPKISFE